MSYSNMRSKFRVLLIFLLSISLIPIIKFSGYQFSTQSLTITKVKSTEAIRNTIYNATFHLNANQSTILSTYKTSIRNITLKTQYPQILHYYHLDQMLSPTDAGLDHNIDLLQKQLQDAVYFNFSHIILEPFYLSKSHNYNQKPINVSRMKVSHYLDLNAMSAFYNVQIMDIDDEVAIDLLHRYRLHTMETHLNDVLNICNMNHSSHLVSFKNLVHLKNTYGITRRRTRRNFWRTPLCIRRNFQQFSPWSKDVTECSKIFHHKHDNTSDLCVIRGTVRRAYDRWKKYTLKQKQLVTEHGISALFIHLAQTYCIANGYRNVSFYLGSDEENQTYYQNVEQILQSRWKPWSKLQTRYDLMAESKGSCGVEMKENAYFLYAVQTNLSQNFKSSVDIMFKINSKYWKRGNAGNSDIWNNSNALPILYQNHPFVVPFETLNI